MKMLYMIADALIDKPAKLADEWHVAALQDASDFVRARIAALPFIIHWGVRCATTIVGIWSCVTGFARFSRDDRTARRRVLNAIEANNIPVFADAVKLVKTLSYIGYFGNKRIAARQSAQQELP